jgi:hypothetical protein
MDLARSTRMSRPAWRRMAGAVIAAVALGGCVVSGSPVNYAYVSNDDYNAVVFGTAATSQMKSDFLSMGFAFVQKYYPPNVFWTDAPHRDEARFLYGLAWNAPTVGDDLGIAFVNPGGCLVAWYNKFQPQQGTRFTNFPANDPRLLRRPTARRRAAERAAVLAQWTPATRRPRRLLGRPRHPCSTSAT